jgi:FHS family glucose/mannose:H+ symporter-like MFS transporter
MPSVAPPGVRRSLVVLHAAFVVCGAATVLLGPLIPELAARWQLSTATLGSLFLIQFTACALGAVFSSLDIARSPVLGYAFMAAGLGGVMAGWPMARVAVAVLGFGVGLVMAATNVLVGRLQPERRGAALSHVNLMWGLGAVACPLLFASLATRSAANPTPWLLAAAASMACAGLAVFLRVPASKTANESASVETRTRMTVLVLLTVQLFTYTGTEAAVGGWVARLCQERDPGHTPLALLVNAYFWGALLAGRAVAPLLLRGLSEVTLHAGALAVAAAGTATLLAAQTVRGTAVGAVVAGFGLAPLFPLIAATVVARTEGGRARAAGTMFSAGGMGSGAVPWLTGQVAVAWGLRTAFWVPAAGVLILAILLARDRAFSGPRSLERAS